MKMNGALKVVIGLILIVIGVYAYLSGWFGGFFAHQLKSIFFLAIGNIPGLVVLIGLVMFLLGISDMKG